MHSLIVESRFCSKIIRITIFLPSPHGPRGRPVPLAAVLEPVRHLGHRQPGPLGQRPLLVGRGVAVHLVRLLQRVARLFLEAVDRLLAVPDGAGKREFPPQPVFVDRACEDKISFFLSWISLANFTKEEVDRVMNPLFLHVKKFKFRSAVLRSALSPKGAKKEHVG